VAQLQCRTEIPNQKSEEAGELTVGQVFHLLCKGDWPEVKKESLELRLEEADKDKLKILGIEFPTKTEANLTVTSYKTGQHQLKAVQLVDAENSVVLGDLNFTVKSVMNPQEPVKEPLGPTGPLQLSLSIWYPLVLLVLIVFVLGFFGYRWKIRRDKKRLLSDMRLEESVQEPYFQFYQSVRKMQRNFSFFSGQVPTSAEITEFVTEINLAYKIYLARLFQIPTLKWSERKILSDFKRNHRDYYKEFRPEIRKALAELSRASGSLDKITGKDCQQLLELLRKNVDQTDKWLKGRKK
jgi:hypothetical protein